MSTQSIAPAGSGWDHLSEFYVGTGDSHSGGRVILYRNGYQEVEIKVRLVAKNAAGTTVQLDADELAQLELTDRDGNSLHGFYCTARNLAFDPFLPGLPQMEPREGDLDISLPSIEGDPTEPGPSGVEERLDDMGNLQDPLQFVTFYLRTIHLENFSVAAQLIHPGHRTLYHTRGPIPVPSAGQFHSLVDVQVVQLPNYGNGWTGYREDYTGNSEFDIDLYVHYLKPIGGVSLQLGKIDWLRSTHPPENQDWFYSWSKSGHSKHHLVFSPHLGVVGRTWESFDHYRRINYTINSKNSIGTRYIHSYRISDLKTEANGQNYNHAGIMVVDRQGNGHKLKLQVAQDGNTHSSRDDW
jgi:hypothetical protein